MICDGNINTFRYVSRHTDLDTYVIDVPDSCSPEAVEYVTMQLKELIQKLEALTGKRLSMDDLSETLARENQSKAYYKEFLKTAGRALLSIDTDSADVHAFCHPLKHRNTGNP